MKPFLCIFLGLLCISEFGRIVSAQDSGAAVTDADAEYNERFAAWKEQILASTAVTGIAASARMTVLVSLSPEKYERVEGAQAIAKQLAISYCQATGVRRAHFYVMLGSRQFADAWSE
jgi:hypothetical protein